MRVDRFVLDNNMSNLNEKLANIESGQPSGWKERANYRRKSREWLNKSAAIAVKITGF